MTIDHYRRLEEATQLQEKMAMETVEKEQTKQKQKEEMERRKIKV